MKDLLPLLHYTFIFSGSCNCSVAGKACNMLVEVFILLQTERYRGVFDTNLVLSRKELNKEMPFLSAVVKQKVLVKIYAYW